MVKRKFPLVEFLKDRIYLSAFDETPRDTETIVHYFVDDYVCYNPFHHDFGPLNIGQMYRFAAALHELLTAPENVNRAVVVYSETDSRLRANAACVLACYLVLVQGWPPHLALAPLAEMKPPVMPFRDAGYATADFVLTIQDVVYGVWKAKEKGLFDIKEFSLEDYELYERVDQGDFNEIPPHYIAFASPQQRHGQTPNFAFKQVLNYFQEHDVQLVVRLNSVLYEKKEFEKRGIKHIDMEFEDGTCPSMLFVQAFLGAAEAVVAKKGKIAVHCKAGLGRTGCLIGAHLIYAYGFSAAEAIAYMRFMRPGMVVGPQQHWLYLHQNDFRDWRYTMALSKLPDRALAGFTPLVPANSPQAMYRGGDSSDNDDEPHTPERRVLGALENKSTISALPIATPGQPRKSPSLSNSRGASLSAQRAGSRTTSINSQRSPSRVSSGIMRNSHRSPSLADQENLLRSPSRSDSRSLANHRSAVSSRVAQTNSDYEDDGEEDVDDDGIGATELSRQIKTRNFTSDLSEKDAMIGEQLRTASNPSPARRRNVSYSKTTTTTTTTVTTVPSRRSSRLASNGSVRKVRTPVQPLAIE